MRIAIIITSLLFLAACASGRDNTPAEIAGQETVNFPALNTDVNAERGQPMMATGTTASSGATSLTLTQPLIFGVGLPGERGPSCGFQADPGNFAKTMVWESRLPRGLPDGTYQCYGKAHSTKVAPDGTTSFWGCNGQEIDDSHICTNGSDYFLAIPANASGAVGAGMGALGYLVAAAILSNSYEPMALKRPASPIQMASGGYNTGNMVKAFFYNGRRGNLYDFIYREYGNYPSHVTKEAYYTYVLSTTNVIGFGQMRAQIISADQSKITFKLLNNF